MPSQKNILALFLTLALIFLLPTQGKAADNISVYLDGKRLPMSGQLVDDRTLVPLRTIGENLGLTVNWNGTTRTVTLTNAQRTILLTIDRNEISVNDHNSYTDVPPKIINNSTYVPLRFISENLSLKVQWDGASQTVRLESIQENPIGIQTIKEKQESAHLNWDVQYPRITGGTDPEITRSINQVIEGKIKETRDWATTMTSDGEEYGYTIDETIDYRVAYNTKGYLSIILKTYSDTGGAHGMPGWQAMTFRLSDGKLLNLADWFQPSADWQSYLNQELTNRFAQRDDVIVPFEAMEPEQLYYLGNDGLVLYFHPYEHTPYASGFVEFAFPLTQLKPMLAISVN